jgi:hypothetical protein
MVNMAHQTQQQEDKDVIHHVEAHGQDMVEEIDHALAKGQPVLMKSSLDRMTVWQAAAAYKKTTLLCMAAAFSASLDGYRACPLLISPNPLAALRRGCMLL